jgi:hypothetical protein
MTDIIVQMPWCCGDKDCDVQWHQANYWGADEDGFYSVDSYADGDHEDCEASEVPSPDEETEGWAEYARHVLETAEDPLGNYMVSDRYKEWQRWQFWFEPSPGGTVVTRARRTGREYELTELHERVLSWLGIDKDTLPYVVGHPLVAAGMGAKELHEIGATYGTWSVLRVEMTIYRSDETVSRELRRLARRHLKQNQRGNP